jgi:hypothetical protein
MGVVWSLVLAFWLAVEAKSIYVGQLSGLPIICALVAFGILVSVGFYFLSVLVIGIMSGPIEMGLGESGLLLRYDTPRGKVYRLLPWTEVQRADWGLLNNGKSTLIIASKAGGPRAFQFVSTSTLPGELARYLPGDRVRRIDNV